MPIGAEENYSPKTCVLKQYIEFAHSFDSHTMHTLCTEQIHSSFLAPKDRGCLDCFLYLFNWLAVAFMPT